MRQILCYGDSNTYGLVPKENARYPWGIRWTSRLNEKLGLLQYRVIEEGLCGRDDHPSMIRSETIEMAQNLSMQCWRHTGHRILSS